MYHGEEGLWTKTKAMRSLRPSCWKTAGALRWGIILCRPLGAAVRAAEKAVGGGEPMTCRGAALRRSPAFTTSGMMGYPTKSQDFVGRGGATERADFGTICPKVA